MARRRKAEPATPQARDISLTIRQGERRGLTQKQIAADLGIDPRTVRKIKSGQTSATRTYSRVMATPRRVGTTPNLYNAEYTVGYDENGRPVLASANLIIADVRTAKGTRRAPTPLDVYRITGLAEVAAAERAAMARRYADSVASTNIRKEDSGVRLRRITTTREPVRATLTTGRQ